MACHQVAEFLSRKGVEFTRRDIRADPQAMEEMVRAGYQSTPVTMVEGQGVVGFDPDAIARLVEG